ncbi:CLUMA_CG017526, isoform A [Clunio marinus]|uniref:CLUMA_CG017526, isoform A n=1 Tax=Clunio marinus TaxID=568069 RepID=A0A1J1J0R9_9DIPT|nr:CLUMA_CG017526, isoform A [Clunio marinus]
MSLFAAAAITIAGFTWHYCSVNCLQKSVASTIEQFEAQKNQCSQCRALNASTSCDKTRDNDGSKNSSALSSDNNMRQDCKSSVENKVSCNPGPITKNAFFNFVRAQRLARCGHPQTEIVREAARRWRLMSPQERNCYKMENL